MPRPTRRPAVARWPRGSIHYQRTFWIDPKLTLSRNNLGLTPRDADRLNEAIGHYEKALRIEPGLFMAHAALGQALAGPGAIPRGRGRDPPLPRPAPPGS